ncbi:MAG TPA: POTRA domain-containing protein [Thermoanaerobaculia bacterium]|nr:POTRA domain-containing protein [Thermoanaerobaculia bacterium]
MRGFFLATGLLLAACATATAEQPEEPRPLFGSTVVSVVYTSDGPVDEQEVARLVSIKAGQPLTEEATGSTIRHLFATRRFSDVRIEAEPAEGGVAVTVHLFRSFRVNPLKFDDGVSVSREEMRRTIPFSEGAVFQAEELEEGAAALKRRLDAEGYVASTVAPEVFFDRKTFDAEVIYHIEAGKPARTAPPLFDGEIRPFTREELVKRMRLDPGDRYRESRARADADRMTKFLKKRMRLRGTVELIAAQPTDDGRVMLVYRISVGPKVVFQTRGIRERRVRREVRDLLEGQIFDEDLILQYVENKRRGLQRKGYYRAKVDYTMSPADDVLTVAIDVESGRKFAVEKISIDGNQAVSDKKLRKLLVTQEKGLPLIRPGRLVDDILRDDADAILGYYQTHGWVNAKVEDPAITEGSKPDRLIVNLKVTEGPRAIVTSRKVIGAEHLSADEIEKILAVETGEPFNPNEVRQGTFSLQNQYRNRGWREAAVRDEWKLSPDGTGAEVTYTVEEGMRSFFGKSIVRGNTRTDTDRITRLVTWDEGDPFSEEKVLTTQRNLTRTGVFRRVEVRPQPADPANQTRAVEIDVQEGRPLSLLYGLGYQYAPDALENRNDPFAIAGISYNNLFGSMRSASIEVQYAPISERGRLVLTFREPFLFNRDIPLNILAFFTREPIQKIDIERAGSVVESSRLFGRYLRLGMRYEYQRIEPVNPQDLSDIEREFSKFDQPIRQSAIGPNMFWDRRDDIIDPHVGYYLTAASKYAFPLLSANARYTKVSGQGAYFRPFASGVFAVAARAGAIFPYGPVGEVPVPIAERFFAGGRSTNRAFDTDLVGIPGATVDPDTRATPHSGEGTGSCAESHPELIGEHPELSGYDCDAGPRIVGGNGFLGLNAEFRFPIFGNVGGTLFYDAAQVWKRPGDIRVALEGDNGLRQGVGVGLRYMTPIGPVRVEYGWPLNARNVPFNVKLLDAKGNVLDVIPAGSRKEKGQFFFSIGYPF